MGPPDLQQLSTPAALLDEQRLDRNIARMQARLAALGDLGTPGANHGYGQVCDVAGNVLDGWVLGKTNQEHGILCRRDARAGAPVTEVFPLGTRVRILPNHACATAAQHDAYHVVRDQRVLATWPRFGGW